jgi:hypothetical protein
MLDSARTTRSQLHAPRSFAFSASRRSKRTSSSARPLAVAVAVAAGFCGAAALTMAAVVVIVGSPGVSVTRSVVPSARTR